MPKTIAVAGTGGVARYLIEELLNNQHKVVVLTRTKKDFLSNYDVDVRVTDYSAQDLLLRIQDCDGIVGAISPSGPQASIEVHTAILKACKNSVKCKHFIPSFWASNIKDYPEHPIGSFESRGPILRALQEQNEVTWTITLVSWFMDYLIPPKNRYLKNIAGIFPLDWSTKVLTIRGKGHAKVSLCSARDAAKSVATLMDVEEWEPYTFLSGSQWSWLDIADAATRQHPSWTVQTKSLAASVVQFAENASPYSRMQAIYEIASHSGSVELPLEIVQAQREKYFQGIHFRTIDEFLAELERTPDAIL